MRPTILRAALALLAPALVTLPSVAPAQGAQRVYIVIADSVPMTVPATATAVADALKGAGWTVLANHPVGGDRSCSYTARVVVVHQPAHTAALLAKGATGAFAAPIRIGVYEDERGVHVAMVNPLSIERTIIDQPGLETSGRTLINEVAGIVAGATRVQRANRAFGQSRDRGLIGKTMGIMAGGPFATQLKVITTAPVATNADVVRMADAIWQRLQQPPKGEWQLTGVYRLDLADQGVVILGVSGAAMETRAFRIVGAGSDDSRSGFTCPGLAHAAAFPLEVVIRRDGANAKVEVIDAMFRMKMYFEDAGRMKFARNMGMPGSIADELKRIIEGRAQ